MAHIPVIRFGNVEIENIGRAAEDPASQSSENLIVSIYPADRPCELTGAPGYIRVVVKRDVTAEKPDLLFHQILLASNSVNNDYANGDDSNWSYMKVSYDRQDPDGENGQQVETESWELKRGLVVNASPSPLDREELELRFYEGTQTLADGGEPRLYSYHPERIDEEES